MPVGQKPVCTYPVFQRTTYIQVEAQMQYISVDSFSLIIICKWHRLSQPATQNPDIFISVCDIYISWLFSEAILQSSLCWNTYKILTKRKELSTSMRTLLSIIRDTPPQVPMALRQRWLCPMLYQHTLVLKTKMA